MITPLSKEPVVFFDVDDTLIKGQSQKLFIKFVWDKGLVSSWFYFRLMFWFLLYKLHIIKDPSVVAVYAFSFLNNMPREKLYELVELFFDQVLVNQFYQDALSIINEHQKKGRQIFLVSNAFDVLVERIATYVKADGYLATELKDNNGILSGEINGIINYGKVKAERVKEFCVKNNISLENSWGYADHPSDIDFLRLMKNPVVVNPSKDFKEKAKDFGFSILEFKK